MTRYSPIMAKVLVVDDEPDAVELVSFNLKAAGYVAKKGEFKLFKKGDGKKRDRKSSTSDSDSE